MRQILLLVSVVAVVCGCNVPVDGQEASGPAYQVVSGACGKVVFDEKLGADYASAFAAVEARKVTEFNWRCQDGLCQDIKLETLPLEVVDERGIPPAAEFYGIRVLDPENGTHLHSVFEVINTSGELFHLEWCPD